MQPRRRAGGSPPPPLTSHSSQHIQKLVCLLQGPSDEAAAMVMGNSTRTWKVSHQLCEATIDNVTTQSTKSLSVPPAQAKYDISYHGRESQRAVDDSEKWRNALLARGRPGGARTVVSDDDDDED